MPPPIRHRTTKKEPRLAPWPAAALEERITGDPESALEQLRPSRASCPPALGLPSGEI